MKLGLMVEKGLREKAGRLFQEISRRIDTQRGLPSTLRYVCGVDASYKGPRAYGASIIYDLLERRVVESVCIEAQVRFPYMPGILYLRESGPMIQSLKRIVHPINMLFIDANGILHPQRCGLACLIGLYLDKPTIGVAKSLLCGEIKYEEDMEYIFLDDERVGFVLQRGSRRKLYVSPGHKVSLEAASWFFGKVLGDQPLPTDLAHDMSRRCVR